MLGFTLGLGRPYADAPSVTFDFASDGAVPDSFSRASPAWDMDLTAYGVDQPRVKPGVGLLLEPAATNIAKDSGAFALDPAGWAGSWARDPVRPVAPDGTATAVELIGPDTLAVLRNEDATYVPGGAFTVSVYVQTDLPGGFPVLVRNDTTASIVEHQILPPPFVASDHGSFRLDPGPGGWWRLSATISAGFGAGDLLGLYIGADGGLNLNGKRIRLWGLNITPGQVVGSPILTPPSAGATRAADSASLIVPPGCTRWAAAYGATGQAWGALSGPAFDLTAPGRPWIGPGNELRWLRMH